MLRTYHLPTSLVALIAISLLISPSGKAEEEPVKPVPFVKITPSIIRAKTKPLATRVTEADKVFVGVVTNIDLKAGDWCHADLKVTKALKGCKVGDIVPVVWRPKIASYDAGDGQEGLALLKYSFKERYWLRSDTFDDPKLAEQAEKLVKEK